MLSMNSLIHQKTCSRLQLRTE